MNLDQLAKNLTRAALHPPAKPDPIRMRRGPRSRVTEMSLVRSVVEARERVAREARKAITG